jgi:hypothetical protein
LIVTHGHGHHRLVRRPETVDLAVEFMAVERNNADGPSWARQPKFVGLIEH